MKMYHLDEFGQVQRNKKEDSLPESRCGINAAWEKWKKDCSFKMEGSVIRISEQECEKRELELSNTDPIKTRNVALVLENAENVILDFDGAMVECEGHLQPLTLINCRNITIKNLRIDWKYPLSAEGRIVNSSHDQIRLQIDPEKYPFLVRDGKLFFCGNGSEEPIWDTGHTVYDAEGSCCIMREGDCIRPETVFLCEKNQIELKGSFPECYPEGSWMVLRYAGREHAGIFAEGCEDLRFEKIDIHATGGLGILCQFCRNIMFRRVRFTANRKKGRRIINGKDDGLHLANNSGKIQIEECSFHGLMDDPINIHGTYARIDRICSDTKLVGRFIHPMSQWFSRFAGEGDKISLIKSSNMERIGERKIRNYQRIGDTVFSMELEQSLPSQIMAGDVIENLNHTPTVEIRNNFIGSCRARGILITTPGKAVIENNLFQTAGSAILMAGDANQWYESGACMDVEIKHNVFAKECLRTKYQFCKGIISICPEIPKPEMETSYHGRIVISDNLFYVGYAPVLYAFSVQELILENNLIVNGDCEAEEDVLEYVQTYKRSNNIRVGFPEIGKDSGVPYSR